MEKNQIPFHQIMHHRFKFIHLHSVLGNNLDQPNADNLRDTSSLNYFPSPYNAGLYLFFFIFSLISIAFMLIYIINDRYLNNSFFFCNIGFIILISVYFYLFLVNNKVLMHVLLYGLED